MKGLANEWQETEVIEQTRDEIFAGLLSPRRFDPTNPPPRAMPIFEIGGACLATPGNLMGVQAKAKNGKTALVVGMLAAPMDSHEGDCLGITASNPRGLAVIHFDTEQSPADHHACIVTALRRAGRPIPPPWLRSYRIADLSIDKRRKLIAFELERAATEHGGIHSAFLDGLADFVMDPNDPAEAFGFVDELHQLAIRFATVLVCVIHENPGSDSGKTRGHLGSQLERKAETNLQLAKEGEVVTIFAERARHAHLPKDRGPRFQWCDEAGMHVSCGTKADAKVSDKQNKAREFAAEVFRDCPAAVGLTWAQVHERIEELEGIKRSGARKRFETLCSAAAIHKSGDKYRLS